MIFSKVPTPVHSFRLSMGRDQTICYPRIPPRDGEEAYCFTQILTMGIEHTESPVSSLFSLYTSLDMARYFLSDTRCAMAGSSSNKAHDYIQRMMDRFCAKLTREATSMEKSTRGIGSFDSCTYDRDFRLYFTPQMRKRYIDGKCLPQT